MMDRREGHFSWADEVEANIESGEGFLATPVRAIHEYTCEIACLERAECEMSTGMSELSIGSPMLPSKAFTVALAVISELEALGIEGVDDFSDAEAASPACDRTETNSLLELANQSLLHESYLVTPPASPPNDPLIKFKEATKMDFDFPQKCQGFGSEQPLTPGSADSSNIRYALSHCDCADQTTALSGSSKRIVVLMDWNSQSACCIDIYGRHWRHDFAWIGSSSDPKTYIRIADIVLETVLRIVEQWQLKAASQNTMPEPQHIIISFATKLRSGRLCEVEEDVEFVDGFEWKKLRSELLHYGPEFELKSTLKL